MTGSEHRDVTVVRAALRHREGLWDLTFSHGALTALAPHGAGQVTGTVVDAAGRATTPGLADHHVHLLAAAAALDSVRCSPATSWPELRTVLQAASPGSDGWIRGVGHDDTTTGLLDAATLDEAHVGTPIRVQHRSGALWVVNSLGIRLLNLATSSHPGVERDVEGRPTGRLWRADDLVSERLGRRPPDLRRLGHTLLSHGVTSLSDATPDADESYVAEVARAIDAGHLHADVQMMGQAAPRHQRISLGPRKIVLADSDLPDPESLAATIAAAHAAGRAVALHCVTPEAYLTARVAFDLAGVHPGDRLEHLSMFPGALLPDLVELSSRGVRVVTQPGFLAERGSLFARENPEREHGDLYRLRSLLEAGVPVALSSDAPYGPLDPWKVIESATTRRTDDDRVLGPAEAVTAQQALDLQLSPVGDPGGPARVLEVGAPADLVVWNGPWSALLAEPGRTNAAVVVDRGAVFELPCS